MNKEEVIEAIKVMQAYVDGKAIQTEYHECDYRIDGAIPMWNWSARKYYIKPEPRECYVAFSEQKGNVEHSCVNPENKRSHYDYVKMREVL